MKHYLFAIMGNSIATVQEIAGRPNDLITAADKETLSYQCDESDNVIMVCCEAATQQAAAVNTFLAAKE